MFINGVKALYILLSFLALRTSQLYIVCIMNGIESPASKIVVDAIGRGQRSLSEFESKRLLSLYGIPVTREELAKDADQAVRIAEEIGYPVVMKPSSHELKHKTELKLIKLGIFTADEVKDAFEDLKKRSPMEIEGVLVQEMVQGSRELMMGLIRDEQFGPCVMFGLGGIFTEVLKDVSFRVAPLEKRDAMEIMGEIKAKALLGPFRGEEAVDQQSLADALIALGNIGMELPQVKEIDINPLIVTGSRSVAVDALVILSEEKGD